MQNRLTGSNAGSDRGHGKENPRRLYAVSRMAQPAPVVRGSSRRIKTLRFRPAHIRLINRRLHRLDHYPRCFPRGPTKNQTRFSKIDKVVPYQRRNLLRLKVSGIKHRRRSTHVQPRPVCLKFVDPANVGEAPGLHRVALTFARFGRFPSLTTKSILCFPASVPPAKRSPR